MRTFTVVVAILALSACNTREKALRAEIGQIRERVELAEQETRSHTADIGAIGKGIHAQVGYRPLVAWTSQFNARPARERTVTFRQTQRHGKLAEDDFDCPWPLGDGGWYAEIDKRDSTKADVLIESLTLTPAPDGLYLSAPLDVSLRSQLHGHFDPCVGGGLGWHPHVSADKRFGTRLQLQFLPLSGDRLPYTLKLVSPNDLSVTIEVDMGDLPNLGIPFRLTKLASELSRGELDLLFETTGQVGPLPDGQTRTYRLRTVAPTFTPHQRGITVATDVEVELAQ